MHPSRTFVRAVQAIAVAFGVTWCVAAAATIPTVVDGRQTLVAVEPLLQTLQLPYVIQGTRLQVGDRPYFKPLVVRDGMEMTDARDIARFLHLTMTTKNGIIVFSSPNEVPDAASSAPPSAADMSGLRRQLIAALNAHRIALGLTPLHIDRIAEQAAQFQAQDMSHAGEMRHQDAGGRTPMQRYAAYGGHAGWYGENVGWYGLDVGGEPALWAAVSKLDAQMMAELPPNDGHRENVLDGHYEAVGIGVSVGPHGLYLAEDFVGP
jgi:uncharacterized protein YkwD